MLYGRQIKCIISLFTYKMQNFVVGKLETFNSDTTIHGFNIISKEQICFHFHYIAFNFFISNV